MLSEIAPPQHLREVSGSSFSQLRGSLQKDEILVAQHTNGSTYFHPIHSVQDWIEIYNKASNDFIPSRPFWPEEEMDLRPKNEFRNHINKALIFFAVPKQSVSSS